VYAVSVDAVRLRVCLWALCRAFHGFVRPSIVGSFGCPRESGVFGAVSRQAR
jgi:hypothetical protein